MSKYNIDITPNLWYVVRENKTYYFVENNKYTIGKITEKQVAHIKEVCDGHIDNAEFLFKEISTNRKIEKKGYSLCIDGFHSTSSIFPIVKLSNVLQEPLQRCRQFETVIYIKDNNRQGNAYGFLGSDRGAIHYDFNFSIMRRAINEKLTKNYKETCYDYYSIPYYFDPDNDTVINYLPLDKDFKFSKTKDFETIIIPFAKEKYLRLKQIVDGFNKLGHALRDFLVSDMKKLLPEMKKIKRIKNE